MANKQSILNEALNIKAPEVNKNDSEKVRKITEALQKLVKLKGADAVMQILDKQLNAYYAGNKKPQKIATTTFKK